MKTRTVDLLRKLISVTYPISIKQLTEEFNISARTVHSDINEVNNFLITKGIPIISTIRNQGLQLSLTEIEKNYLVEELKDFEMSYYTKEERSFDLLMSLTLSDEKIYLYQKEIEYSVSKSTLDEDMRRLREELLKYGIEITSIRKQGLVLKGLERSIRTMVYDLINKQVGIIDMSEGDDAHISVCKKILYRYLPRCEFKKIDQVFQESLSDYDDNFYKNQIILFTIIWIYRMKLNESISFSKIDNKEHENHLIKVFIEQVSSVFHLTPSHSEKNYIYFMIETFSGKDINNSLEWVQAQLLSIQLVQFVEEETKIPFSKKESTLFESLYKHIAGLINRLKNNIQITNPIAENVKKNYREIYCAVNRYIPMMEDVIGIRISDDEIAFLVIHFSTIVSSLNQDIQLIYNCIVICNHGFATGNLLAENLKEKYPEIKVVAILSSKEINVIDKLDVDLIFSTYSLAIKNKPILVTSPIINEDNEGMIRHFLKANTQYQRLEIIKNDTTNLFNQVLQIIGKSGGIVSQEIYQLLETEFKKSQLQINTREIQPMLKDILTDNHILINKKVESWEDAIETVSLPLLRDKSIEENYVDAMINAVNEFGPYIVIGKHLALAHARPEDGVNNLGISVATIRNPVNFGNKEMDPVKIIFCLAATDSYAHLNIMKELVELINNDERLDKLIQSVDIQTFKEILFD